MKYENRRFAPLAPRTSRKIFTSVLLSFVSVFTSVAKLQFRRSAFPYLPETKAANRSTGKFPADRYPRNAFGFSTPSTGRGLQTPHWRAAVSQSVFSQSAAAGAEHWVAPSGPYNTRHIQCACQSVSPLIRSPRLLIHYPPPPPHSFT